MATKKYNIIVIGTSIVVSLAILIWGRPNHTNPHLYDYRVYTVINGWGYDILVDDSLFIHQESVPAVAGNHPFTNKELATQAAQLIIDKLKHGHSPTITKAEAQQFAYDKQGKYQ